MMNTETVSKSPVMPSPTTTQSLNDLLDETCRRHPNRISLITATQQYTFTQLQGRILKAAAAFKARGVRKGDCVSIVLRNSPEFIIAYFGLARLGAIAVPINFLIHKAEELRYMLNDCSAIGIVTQKEFLPGILAAKKTLPAMKYVWSADSEDAEKNVENFQQFVDAAPRTSFGTAVLGNVSEGASPSPDILRSPAAADDTCAILYTSGTTGSPKGVMLSHANLVSNCDASIKLIGVREKDVLICILPMFHSFAWTANVLIPLRLGLKNIVSPSITPAKPWLSMMGKYGVTIFSAVPPVYAVLAKETHGLKGLVLKYWFFRKVRFGVSGAAPLSTDVAAAFEKALGVPIQEGYGLTETSPVATINPPGAARVGSVGKVIEGVQLKIISDNETVLPTGEEGEICIRGSNVMKGYYRLPDATRESFTKDGWFKTGDIGVLDQDGYLYLRDRKKDMIIIKGLKVFSAQVEQVISAHEDVEETAIVGIPDGSGDELIKAFIVLKPGAKADKTALMQFCRAKLDPYKRPRDIEIVEALPKNALQKVLKRVLRQKELDKRK